MDTRNSINTNPAIIFTSHIFQLATSCALQKDEIRDPAKFRSIFGTNWSGSSLSHLIRNHLNRNHRGMVNQRFFFCDKLCPRRQCRYRNLIINPCNKCVTRRYWFYYNNKPGANEPLGNFAVPTSLVEIRPIIKVFRYFERSESRRVQPRRLFVARSPCIVRGVTEWNGKAGNKEFLGACNFKKYHVLNSLEESILLPDNSLWCWIFNLCHHTKIMYLLWTQIADVDFSYVYRHHYQIN
jgi:hypothetical protein